MPLLFKYPIEIGMDLCNCCNGKTKRLGLHGHVVRSKYITWAGLKGMDVHSTRFCTLYKKYLVLAY